MKKYIIKKQTRNSGAVNEISSYKGDREIIFRKGCKYAVVIASHYVEGGRGYTTHKTKKAAINQAKRVREYSYRVIDDRGRRCDWDELVPLMII